jgi:hypothetical protein
MFCTLDSDRKNLKKYVYSIYSAVNYENTQNFYYRKYLATGTVILDMEATSFEAIIDLLLEHMINNDQVKYDLAEAIKELLLQQHRHQFQGLRKIKSEAIFAMGQASGGPLEASSSSFILSAVKSFSDMRNASMASFAEMRRNFSGDKLESVSEVASGGPLKQNEAFLKKIPRDAEAANILVAEVDFLTAPVAVFIRLEQAAQLGDLTEVALNTRFIFILLGNKYQRVFQV